MKKYLSLLIAIFISVYLVLNSAGCLSSRCDPRGKDWYNYTAYPYISTPFNELYDGSYSIKIDERGNVQLKTLNGETINGVLTIENKENSKITNVYIEFENGKKAEGSCLEGNSERVLNFYYEANSYRFYDSPSQTKEELDQYRSQFIDFLSNVYKTETFPTQEEISTNDLYRRFTYYRQIDPCCNGPIVYDSVEKATIEKIEPLKYGNKLTVTVNGESREYQSEQNVTIAVIRNGELKKLDPSEIHEGECLISKEYHYRNGEPYYEAAIIYYVEDI